MPGGMLQSAFEKMDRRPFMKQAFRHIFDHETVTPLLIFLFLSGVYFATLSGITSSNDGSHYALMRTMVENGRFTLDQFDDYAEGNDIALVGDKLYSDRPPGNGLAAALFYTAAGPLPAPPAPLPSRHDAENPRLLYVLLLPVLAGAGTAVLLYTILRAQASPAPPPSSPPSSSPWAPPIGNTAPCSSRTRFLHF
jgi:hypothetical protein